MMPYKRLCHTFLLAFLALTVHRTVPPPVLDQLTNRNVPVKIFNCSVNVKTKDSSQLWPFQDKFQHHCLNKSCTQKLRQNPFPEKLFKSQKA